MPLTLTIIGGAPLSPGNAHSHTWNQRGGTLGRADSNDWTLPDPEQSISRCHARVRYEQGRYLLEDTSTNGILLGDGVTPMGTTTPHPLQDGEELGIGGYRIRVRIDPEAMVSPGSMAHPGSTVNPGPIGGPPMGSLSGDAPQDPLALLGGQVEAPIDPLQPAPRHESYLNEHFDLPAFEHPAAPPPMPPVAPSAPPTPGGAVPGGSAPSSSASGGSAILPDDWWTQPAPTAPIAAPPTPAPMKPVATPPVPPMPGETATTPPPIPGETATTPAPMPGETATTSAPMPGETATIPPPMPGETATIPAPMPGEPATTPPVPQPEPAAPPIAPPPIAPPPIASSPVTAPPMPPTTASPPAAGAPLQGEALRELLRGAGLDPEQLPPELAEDLGGILRIAVQGVMDLMRARAEIKNEFRMSVTLIQASDNNPLKFSTNVDDALNNLLVKRNPSYLSAIEAFESGFEDLRFHQVALLSGMRDAFFEMLRQLDPATLEKRFQEQSGQGSMLGRIARPKPWDQYKNLFAEINRDTEGYFNRLFGETFVAAYERRMQELQDHARRRE